jgi:hypothetical protein
METPRYPYIVYHRPIGVGRAEPVARFNHRVHAGIFLRALQAINDRPEAFYLVADDGVAA